MYERNEKRLPPKIWTVPLHTYPHLALSEGGGLGGLTPGFTQKEVEGAGGGNVVEWWWSQGHRGYRDTGWAPQGVESPLPDTHAHL